MQNTIMQKSEFSKMRDCSGFLQIGSHITEKAYTRLFIIQAIVVVMPRYKNFFVSYMS